MSRTPTHARSPAGIERSAHGSALKVERFASDADRATSDADQAASDADQSSSHADQTASERDEADAISDQRAADLDQASANRNAARETTEDDAKPDASRAAREASRVSRLTTRRARTETARTRLRVAGGRDATAATRDATARLRDLRAEATERALADSDMPISEQLERLHLAASDARVRAASDRAQAAEDRVEAVSDRGRLAAIIEESPDAVLIVDYPGLRVTYANAAFARDVGLAVSDIVGRSVPDVVAVALDPATIAGLMEVTKTGRPWLGEADRRLADGSFGRVQIRSLPHLGADDTPEEFLLLMHDVTELRRGEADRLRLATAVEQAADFIVVDDASGIVQAVNPAFERLTGYPATAAVGRPIQSLLRSGVDPPEVYAALDDAMLHGKAWVGLVSERRADGSLLRVELSLSPIRDAAGNIVGTVEIGRDRTREAEFEAERDRATRLRAALDQALHDQPPGASLEVAAQVLCDRLAVLPEIDFVSVFAFGTPGEIQSVAHRAPPGFPPAHSGSAMRAARMHERASDGPWAGAWVPSVHDGTWARALSDLGARAAGNWPVTHGDHVGGVLMIVTSDADFAASLLGDGAARFDLGGTASALLGERMHARRTERGLRDALEATLNARAFHPVFQPIVELETGETMGYEALTRFDSGQRPDLCFADAWSVGLGLELELATLEAAVAAAKELPPGTWLDLNASPRLLADSGRLREILWSADRPLVLEVTEHERIEDYDALRAAVRELGDDLRVAVDDAGAGIANFGHIIDLRPDFVKLDISLVRQVNANLGRQAMVVGMRHFSRTAGCRLIAEGVETEDEARTLTALGVEFGQGYHFGHPGAADVWTAAGDSQGTRGHATLPPDTPRKDVP